MVWYFGFDKLKQLYNNWQLLYNATLYRRRKVPWLDSRTLPSLRTQLNGIWKSYPFQESISLPNFLGFLYFFLKNFLVFFLITSSRFRY